MKIKISVFFALLCLLLSFSALAGESPIIRVGINYGSSAIDKEVSLSFENGFQTGFVADDGFFMPFGFYEYDTAIIKASGNTIKLYSGSGDFLYECHDGLSVGICPIASELSGEDYIPFTKIGSIKYPEVLLFSASNAKITIINVIDAELYFKGVLPSEVYPSWHEEALKAAAIATRTYTYKSKHGKHASLGFDVCDTTCCQVYSGVTKCQPSTNRAVEETRNMVLTYGGNLITAVYHAISGGITESAAGAWGSDPAGYPYLTVVETPFESYNEIARGHWTKTLYDENFNSLILNSSYAGQITAPIIDISSSDTTPGYLSNVTLTDASGRSIYLATSSHVRSFFSVLSSNFTVSKVYTAQPYAADSAKIITKDGISDFSAGSYAAILSSSGKETVGGVKRAYRLDGKGHGHGVGLSQYGAQYAAKQGYTFDQILSIYFPGTVIQNYMAITGE